MSRVAPWRGERLIEKGRGMMRDASRFCEAAAEKWITRSGTDGVLSLALLRVLENKWARTKSTMCSVSGSKRSMFGCLFWRSRFMFVRFGQTSSSRVHQPAWTPHQTLFELVDSNLSQSLLSYQTSIRQKWHLLWSSVYWWGDREQNSVTCISYSTTGGKTHLLRCSTTIEAL